MKLSQLFKEVSYVNLRGDINREVNGLTQDSRDHNLDGYVYCAIKGYHVDGHDYIEDAISKGACVIVCEYFPEKIYDHCAYIQVENTQKILGELASAFYHHPSRELTVVAVTGTNGKTSVANYLSQTLQLLGKQVLLISTAGDTFNGETITIKRKEPTSLEVVEFHRVLRLYADQGAEYVCTEATSIGLDQYRFAGVDVDIAAFTNLTPDHLDYHGAMDEYAQAKKRLFDDLKKDAVAIVNMDDSYASFMVSDTDAKKVPFGSSSEKLDLDYSFKIQSIGFGMIQVLFNNIPLRLPVIGMFNVYNLLLVFGVLSECNFKYEHIVTALESVQGIPGRVQSIPNNHRVLVLVDYAHSSDSLQSVLVTLNELPHRHIITVVGCGGDRDRTKRGPMAHIAQKLSDKVLYTADNPRTESLDQIFEDMKIGVDVDNNNYSFIASRERAIAQAIEKAQEGDIILIAGKGHEDYQEINGVKEPFDDRILADKYLNNK